MARKQKEKPTKKLRVWWIPQVPMEAFRVPVKTTREAYLLLGTLAAYDLFQFENKIKPDYSNTGGLEQFNEETKDWEDFFDEETGLEWDEYIEDFLTDEEIENYFDQQRGIKDEDDL